MRVFLDSSGKIEDSYLTLAAFAGNDEIWKEFETEWAKILSEHVPPAKYIHMKELVQQRGEFHWSRGWNLQSSFSLVMKCLMYMQHLDKQRFTMFYCAVDLEAWRKLKAETYQVPDPIELCNTFCSKTVMAWYFNKSPGVLDPMTPALHYFFDRNEYFKQPFEGEWNRERNKADATGGFTIWNLVKEVSAVDMRDVPGVQAADVLAWAVNRESTSTGNVPGKLLPAVMRNIIPSYSIVWDESKMREKFRPLIYQP